MFMKVFRDIASGQPGNRHRRADPDTLNLETLWEPFRKWLRLSPSHTAQ
jgi:hypothetical protein